MGKFMIQILEECRRENRSIKFWRLIDTDAIKKPGYEYVHYMERPFFTLDRPSIGVSEMYCFSWMTSTSSDDCDKCNARAEIVNFFPYETEEERRTADKWIAEH